MAEIHRALTARGEHVVVATHGGPHERVLADAGVAYEVLGAGWDATRSAAFVRSVPGIGTPDQSMWSDEELRVYTELEVDFFRRHAVRVAVTGWTLTALLSTRVAGIPLVTEHAGSFIPPLLERGLIPGVSAGIADSDVYTGGFNRIAGELGVEGVPSFPALLLGDLTLVTEVPEILGMTRSEIDGWRPARQERFRSGTRLRCTGPIFAHLATPLPARVDAFLAEPGLVVYVAITSSNAELVRSVVRALRPLGARLLVASTVHDLDDLDDAGHPGGMVCVAGVLPSHEVMVRADLAVTAGGQGSVQTAVATGTPLVGIPLQPEQAGNVALVERQGAAATVSVAEAGGPTLLATARRLLDDPAVRANARRLQHLSASIDGPAEAAEAIGELVASWT